MTTEPNQVQVMLAEIIAAALTKHADDLYCSDVATEILADPRLAVLGLPEVDEERLPYATVFKWADGNDFGDYAQATVWADGRIELSTVQPVWHLGKGDDPMPWLAGLVAVTLKAIEEAKAVRNG